MKEIPISDIKSIFTTNANLDFQKYFADKPKIFMKLACRGNISSKGISRGYISSDKNTKSSLRGPNNVKAPMFAATEGEILTIWSNTSSKAIQDNIYKGKGGFLTELISKKLQDDNVKYKPLGKIIMSLADIISKKTNGSECIETTSSCKKEIFLQRTTDDPAMFEFFITGLYDKIKKMQVNIKETLSLNSDLYINTHTKVLIDGEEKIVSLEKEMDDFFDQKEMEVCIIQGASGSGKSMFMTQIYQNKLKDYKPGEALSILINLNKYKNAIKKSSLVETYLHEQGFSNENIKSLKNNHDLLLLLDG